MKGVCIVKKILFLILLASTFLIPLQINAEVIVDTGVSANLYSGYAIDKTNPVAAEFSVSGDYEITNIYGLMNSMSMTSRNLNISLYKDDALGGEVPGTQIYSQNVEIDPYFPPHWQGLNNISWNVTAGTYWVSFGGADDLFSAAMPLNPPNKLNYAFYATTYGGYDVNRWFPNDWYPICVKILGNPTSVLEPSTSLLLGLGLLGLAGLRRKLKR